MHKPVHHTILFIATPSHASQVTLTCITHHKRH